jgi:hypothetical protein
MLDEQVSEVAGVLVRCLNLLGLFCTHMRETTRLLREARQRFCRIRLNHTDAALLLEFYYKVLF